MPGFLADNAAPLLVGASALVVAGVHVPVRGRALRDRWRGPNPVPTAGARIVSADRDVLPMPALVDAVAECPVPVDVVSVHRRPVRATGEAAHRYRGFADQLGVAEPEWASVLVGGPAEHDRARLDFFIHRLGLLGLRARPLSPGEFDLDAATEPERLLARAPGRGHVRRPHLWFTPAHDFDVPHAPAQLVGTSRDGGPLVMSLPSLERLDVVADPARLAELLVPTLITGARIGIRTHRPRAFGILLDHGAVPVTAAGDPTVDLLVLDRGATADGSPRTAAIMLHDAPPPEPSGPARADVPRLIIGAHAWHLRIGDAKTPVRPLPIMSAKV
ncbi:hypothetical protein ACFORJ_02975 [Corynebacterium hansenii]|uniref:Uncharacterized protein n=1 Tax=Corynebacterium hansenii TaxID=394964 RepID=A0ABV7ZKP5_9CORY|nr:hypothetical protein [Corynebacterium hansenii]WJY99037.1 hypothetical protein CHAN_02030 [Corynebacterium hansenii]